MMRSCLGVAVVAVVAVLAGGGCVSFGKSDAASFYVLSSLAPTAGHREAGAAETVIGLRPVRIPDYLDRPEIVTRPSENRVSVAGFDRWAQPLDEDISRVLAEDLAALRSAARVLEFPWHPSTKVDYHVEVHVVRFESVSAGDVLLVARWVLTEADGETVRGSGTSTITTPCEGADHESIVAAMSEALAALSREVAAAIPESPGR